MTARGLRRVAKTQVSEMGQSQLHMRCDMAQRVRALVAELIGIGRTANADRVEDEKESALHGSSGPMRVSTGDDRAGDPPKR